MIFNILRGKNLAMPHVARIWPKASLPHVYHTFATALPYMGHMLGHSMPTSGPHKADCTGNMFIDAVRFINIRDIRLNELFITFALFSLRNDKKKHFCTICRYQDQRIFHFLVFHLIMQGIN